MGFGWSQDMGTGQRTCPKCVGTARSQPDCFPQPSASQGHSYCPLESCSSWFMTQLLPEFLQEVPLCKPHSPTFPNQFLPLGASRKAWFFQGVCDILINSS